MDMEGERSKASGGFFTDPQNFPAKPSMAEPGTYILDADKVAYIVIKCRTSLGGKSQLLSRIRCMNPFSCGIEPPERERLPRPYLAIGMLFDLRVDAGCRHYGLPAGGAEALPTVDHEDQVKQYGVARVAMNLHMLHRATAMAILMLNNETSRVGGLEDSEAQDRLRMVL